MGMVRPRLIREVNMLTPPGVPGVNVVLDGRGANSPHVYGNKSARAEWLAQQVDLAARVGVDGINFDMVMGQL